MAENVVALNADVVWRANTGQAERDVESLRRQFHEATQSMSTQALRAASAQEKLDRALVKHGVDSKAARDAEIALRRVMAETTVTAERQTGALERSERSVERLGRGALVGSGAIHGLARAAVFASTSFLGGFGLVYALRTAVTAGEELEVSQRKLDTQLEANGESTERGRRILAALDRQMIDVGHTSTETAAAFTILDRSTGDAAKAADLMGLAADLAAAKNTTLEKAALIVAKVVNGNTGILKRNGVAVKDGATVTEALAAAQEKLAGQAKAAVTPQQQLHAAIVNTEAAIGKDLLPTVQRLETQSTKWLSSSENQARIQRDVNEAVRVGGRVAHGLADGLDAVRAVAGPVVDELGGVERTAKLLIEALAVYKLAKVAGAIRGIGVQWGFVATQADLAAAAEGRAATGGLGGVLGLRGAGRVVGLEPLPGGLFGGALFGAALALASRGEAGKHIGGPLDVSVSPGAGDGVGYKDPVTGKYHLIRVDPNKPLGPQIAADIKRRHPDYIRATAAGSDTSDRQPGSSPRGPGAFATPGASSAGDSGPGRKHGFSLTYALQLEVARAAAGQGSVLGAAQDELRYVKAQLAAGRLNKKGILDALAQEAQLEDQIDGILSSAAAAKEAKEAKREAAAKKRREAEKRRLERERAREKRERARQKAADDAWFKEVWHDVKFLTDQRVQYAKQLNDAAKATGKTGSSDGIDFFSEAAANFRTYGSNIGGVLSGQDARGLLAGIALTLRSIDGHAKTTAKTNTQIVKAGPHPAKTAAALAEVGAWTH